MSNKRLHNMKPKICLSFKQISSCRLQLNIFFIIISYIDYNILIYSTHSQSYVIYQGFVSAVAAANSYTQ